MYTYLIRYGIMGHVGRFSGAPECDGAFERGQIVVVHTPRGVELGEVLLATPEPEGAGTGASGVDGAAGPDERPRVLRPASAQDVAESRHAAESRPSRFALCQDVLERANWPWDLLDVEPLLDGRSIVLHYLGPHRLDATLWRARFRALCDLDVVLEPAGLDVDDEDAPAGCGNCNCGDHGCATDAEAHAADDAGSHGCTTQAHAGCASCGISQMLAARRR